MSVAPANGVQYKFKSMKINSLSSSHNYSYCFNALRPAELGNEEVVKSGNKDDGYVFYFHCIFERKNLSSTSTLTVTVTTTLLFYLHRNKENVGTAPCRRRQSTAMNPYSQPLPFNQNERKALSAKKTLPCLSSSIAPPASRTSTAKAITNGSKSSNTSLATIEEETSPTIRRILEATGCSSRQELLAKRAAEEKEANANGSKSTNANGSKSTNTNGSEAAPNQPKAAPNRPKAAPNGATNRAESSNNKVKKGAKPSKNGSKATTNPKKKAKGKHLH